MSSYLKDKQEFIYNNIIQNSDKDKKMSIFLYEDQQFQKQLLFEMYQTDSQDQKFLKKQQNIEDLINAELRKNKDYSCFQGLFVVQNMNFKEYHMVIINPKHFYRLKLTILVSKLSEIMIKIQFIQNQSRFFKFSNKNSISYFVNNQQKYIKNRFNLYSISTNTDNGHLRLSYPKIIIYQSKTFLKLIKKFMPLTKSANQQQYQYSKLISLIQQISEIKASTNIISEHQNKDKIYNYNMLYRYHSMIMSSNHIIQQIGQSDQTIKKHTLEKTTMIKKLIKDQQRQLQNRLTKSNMIVTGYQQNSYLKRKNESYYTLTSHELNRIKLMIAMPFLPKPKNLFDNNMIFNFIRLQNPQSLKLQRVDRGGFAYIYLSQIVFKYVFSEDGAQLIGDEQPDPQRRKLMSIHKHVAIKEEKSCSLYDIHQQRQKYNRNEHQLLILKRIKNGQCIFLPKYYFPINCPKSLSKSIFLDFIPFKNLKSYVKANKKTLSLTSKLYFLFSISQALRYISYYQIVHLDLKPTNIMVFCNLLVKLIDFGQSYHPEVCKNKNYQPGFTLPYSSPQLFDNQYTSFTSKSDVFSLGIIMYQLLYDQFPYHINNTQQTTYVQAQSYLKKWYFVAQQTQNYGNRTVQNIMNSIISKCLDNDPMNRPALDWIAVNLRHCLQILS